MVGDVSLYNAIRNNPFGIHVYSHQRTVQQWRLGLHRATSYFHAEDRVASYGIKTKSRYIDQNIFLLPFPFLLSLPTTALHVAKHLLPVCRTDVRAPKLGCQTSIHVSLRFHILEEAPQTVGHDFPHRNMEKTVRRMLHPYIVHPIVPNPDGIGVAHVKTVKHKFRIHVSITLSGTIAEVCFCKVKFQTGIHIVYLKLTEVQRAHTLQVFPNLPDTERLLAEPHPTDTGEIVQQGVCTTIHAIIGNPKIFTTINIVPLRLPVSCRCGQLRLCQAL